MPDQDYFADVRGMLGGSLGGGCLSGPGLEEHHRSTTKMAQDRSGMDFTCACDNCGQPNRVTVTWNELIFCSVGALPKDWKYHPGIGALYPNVGCRSCNGLLMLTFTPDECDRHLRAGVSAGAVQGAYVAQAQNAVRQRMGAQAQR